MSQPRFPLGLFDWLHFFPASLEPVSILAFFLAECRHGRVVDGIKQVRPFGIRVAGCWLHSKFLLEAASEALSLNGVGSATGVDALVTPGLPVMDLSRLQSDLACNERVVCVTVSAVIASCMEDTAEVHSPSDDEV